MAPSLKTLLARFPRDMTIGQILDSYDAEEDFVRESNIRCTHANCGRLIIQAGRNWVHLAPNGHTSRSCRSAAFHDPKHGDEDDKSEWLEWPVALRRQNARAPRR